ncbi:hypothetical protein ADIS_3658 [Lunatimonas lonarensis]|uniref:histidine kinase n=1 Tax=Lunatimonas lonarensis TaxID=1232681 RepID=R7ZNV9_9BACT|nr:hypothetical protein ADIS_3658 [Lunatimonas lonarensis]
MFQGTRLADFDRWESFFETDGEIVSRLRHYFDSNDRSRFDSLSGVYDDKLSMVWDIQAAYVEGIGPLGFAFGRGKVGTDAVDPTKGGAVSETGAHYSGTWFALSPLLSTLSRFFLDMDAQSWSAMIPFALNLIGNELHLNRCAILLLNSAKNGLERESEWHREHLAGSAQPIRFVSLEGKSDLIRDLRAQGWMRIPSFEGGSFLPFEEPELRDMELGSVLLIPITAKGVFFGVLLLGSPEKDAFQPDRTNPFPILLQVGDLFGAAMVKQREKSDLYRGERLLQETELLAKSGSWRFLRSEKRIYLSQGLRKLFGLDASLEYMGMDDFFKLVSPEDRKFVRQELKRVLRTSKVVSGEFRYQDPAKQERVIAYSIQVNDLSPTKQLEIFGFCSDITERKALEEELLLESQILAQVNEAIFMTDVRFNVIYMNQQARIITGRSSGFKGSINELFQLPESPSPLLTDLASRYLQEEVCKDIVRLQEVQQGSVFDCRMVFSKIWSKKGELLGYTLLLNDLTEEREREELAKKAKLIVEKSPAILFTLDPTKHFQITYVTENIVQFGYTAKDLILGGISFLDLIHPDDIQLYLRSFKEAEKHANTREYRVRTSRGKYRWVEDKVSEIRVANGDIVWYEGLFQDITERKKDRAEIEKVKNQYRVLASNIPYTNVFLIDPDYRYVVAEGPNFEYWGLDKEYFEGKTIEEANTTNFDKILPLFKKAKKSRNLASMELKYMKRTYQLLAMPIFDGNELAYFLGIIRDITRERNTQQALEKSEQKYRNLVEESTELIFSIDTGLSVSYVSPNIKQFLGYETFEFTGRAFMDHLHPGDRAVMEEHGKQAPFGYFKKYPVFDCRMQHRDKSFRIFSVSGKLIYDENGEIKYYTGVARDNTKLKETQRELFLAKERAEKALEAKSQFLSIMSHEIRTPMNAVIGLSHLLLEENPREDQYENLRTLQFSAENLLGLINDILDFNKIDSGKVELECVVFDLRHLINRIVRSYAYQIREKSLDLVLDFGSELPAYIMGDPVRLSQILNNLLSNAIKFTKEGNVSIQARQLARSKTTVSVRFQVSDTGIGIPAGKLDYVFEAFTQASSDTTRKFGGTGLGLAIVKKLIVLLGSEIHVDSEEGKGTTFWFDLDFDLAESHRKKGSTEVRLLKDLQKSRILVAEDNVVNQVLLKKYLKKWGVGTIEFAQNGQVALEYFEQGEFDLLLIDLQMPVMDGIELAKLVRAKEREADRRVPIIALTASSFSEVQEQLEKAGMDDYVSKPFNPPDLYTKIIKYI